MFIIGFNKPKLFYVITIYFRYLIDMRLFYIKHKIICFLNIECRGTIWKVTYTHIVQVYLHIHNSTMFRVIV